MISINVWGPPGTFKTTNAGALCKAFGLLYIKDEAVEDDEYLPVEDTLIISQEPLSGLPTFPIEEALEFLEEKNRVKN